MSCAGANVVANGPAWLAALALRAEADAAERGRARRDDAAVAATGRARASRRGCRVRTIRRTRRGAIAGWRSRAVCRGASPGWTARMAPTRSRGRRRRARGRGAAVPSGLLLNTPGGGDRRDSWVAGVARAASRTPGRPRCGSVRRHCSPMLRCSRGMRAWILRVLSALASRPRRRRKPCRRPGGRPRCARLQPRELEVLRLLPAAGRTSRSPMRCSSPARPRRSTSRTSSPSWAWRAAARRARPRIGWASARMRRHRRAATRSSDRVTRRGAWLPVLVLAVAGCGLPGLPTPGIQPIVVVRNEAPNDVQVRWTGTSGGATTVEPCEEREIIVAPGPYLFEVESRTDRGGSRSWSARAASPARSGSVPTAAWTLGHPSTTSGCANT